MKGAELHPLQGRRWVKAFATDEQLGQSATFGLRSKARFQKVNHHRTNQFLASTCSTRKEFGVRCQYSKIQTTAFLKKQSFSPLFHAISSALCRY